MKQFATADCETDPFKYGRVPKPFIWGFYDGVLFHRFYEQKDFIDFIKEYEGIIYFHNGGKFDVHFFFHEVEEQEKIMIINGRIAKFQLGKAEIRDSYLLLPVPLSAYQKDEIDYNIMEEEFRNIPKNKKEIEKYLEGDCVYLWNILAKNFELYGQHLTLASSAFKYWRNNYDTNKKAPRTSRAFFEDFKEFYYGGRVECFAKGIIEKPFTVHDINSAYPEAMLRNHPYGKEYKITRTLPSDSDWGLSFIRFRGVSHGALPFRDKEGQWTNKNTLNFFNDNIEREYSVTGWELKTAIDLGKVDINKIFEVITFENSINFSGYVNEFYEKKSNLKGIDAAEYLLAKLYLNSLYGKFGQSSLDHREFSIIRAEHIEGYINEGYEFETMLGIDKAIVSCPIPPEKQNFYNVATAASITGYVRANLFKHISICGEPLYCDTDSLASVNFKGSIGKELGQWEKEGDFSMAAIGGKKLYAFKYADNNKYKISSKGVKLSAQEIISVARGENILYKNIAPTFSVNKEPVFIERLVRMT